MSEYNIDEKSPAVFDECMKVRDSGMPEAGYWESLFDVPLILCRMQVEWAGDVAEVGCGYGTFTIAAARSIRGRVFAIDIDPQMTEAVAGRATAEGLLNVEIMLRDIADEGTGLTEGSVDYVMLFNILHHDRPEQLLAEARRILKPGGIVGCIHWNYDTQTPRGPALEIRPRPEQIRQWILESGFAVRGGQIDLPPYHYGWLGQA